MLLEITKLQYGSDPSDGVVPKLYKFVKPVPSVLSANTVPLPELPPLVATPKRVLPEIIKPARGFVPSLLVLEMVAVK